MRRNGRHVGEPGGRRLAAFRRGSVRDREASRSRRASQVIVDSSRRPEAAIAAASISRWNVPASLAVRRMRSPQLTACRCVNQVACSGRAGRDRQLPKRRSAVLAARRIAARSRALSSPATAVICCFTTRSMCASIEATRGTSVVTLRPAARACVTRRTSSRANRVRPAVGPTQFASPRIASSCSTADLQDQRRRGRMGRIADGPGRGKALRLPSMAINCRVTPASSWCRSRFRPSAVESSCTVSIKCPTWYCCQVR